MGLSAEPVFEASVWDEPLDAERHIAATPEKITAKGMFFSTVLSELERRGRPRPAKARPYSAFGSYPIRELMRLQIEAIPELYPELSLREGLRRLGHLAYPVFSESFLGRVVFAKADGNPRMMARLASKGYRHAASTGKVTPLAINATHAVLHLEEVWNFVDSFHVGAFEGALHHVGYDAKVTMVSIGPAETVFNVNWSQDPSFRPLPHSSASCPLDPVFADHMVQVLTPVLGPHTTERALLLVCERVEKARASLTLEDLEEATAVLRPMLRTLVGQALTEEIIISLRRSERA